MAMEQEAWGWGPSNYLQSLGDSLHFRPCPGTLWTPPPAPPSRPTPPTPQLWLQVEHTLHLLLPRPGPLGCTARLGSWTPDS